MKVFWLDRNLLKSRIRRAAKNLSREHEAVVRVVLFGSVASDRALPSSDADILVVVRDSDLPFIDRAGRFRDYFSDIGVGVDLFVYTEQEVAAGTIPLAANALRTGIELYPAESARPLSNTEDDEVRYTGIASQPARSEQSSQGP